MTIPRIKSIGRSISNHTVRQLKFIIPGAVITYAFNTHRVFLKLLTRQDVEGLARLFALASTGLEALVIILFLYVLLVPWIHGLEPDYQSWRDSGILSSVIPILTVAILVGWSLLSFTLGRWSSLGYLEGVVGASGIYALTFGLLGLLPAPKVHRS
ncbi:uncharacterized protein EDB91DRAFT_1063682 [Suillus paluster]|uniref:uncharacterized protein n=1 Tax=Suillus paluster TaxID=48578 RepID=UPI001B86BD39|nr:uncharacterized protein EDB91DRAFT_1063682 [Suillus paluster]KAG1722967.1 hypothetical protein EDB91DRAFT_1063682 [Suillus paluster]